MYKNSDARERVLYRLRAGGPATVGELASEMGVVAVTMRSHLHALRAQGLVEGQDERGHVGRPRRRSRVTAQAESMLPNRSAGLAADLLHGLQDLAGRRGVDQLLDLAAARYAAEHAAAVQGSLAERVVAVAGLLQDESGSASWQQEGDRYVIRDFHCPYLQLARERDDICRYHTQVVTRLLGEPATLARTIVRGDRDCVFAVAARPARAAGVRTLSDGRLAPERG